jgi:vacuolar-type H+-ATPase subunit H
MQGVPVGQRNITAARLLGRWLGLGATSTEAWALLKAWNHGLDISLDEKELQIIFNSIAKAEATKQQFRKQIDGVKEEAKQAITQAKEGAKQTVTQAQEELKARLLRVRQEAKEGAKKQAAEAKEKAKEKITEVKEKAKKVPDPEVKSEDYSSIPKPTLCAAITANLGLPVNIIEVVKYLGDPPKYYLIFDNGRRASLGSGGGILNQRVFQEAIVNALNIAIVPLPKKQWAGVVQLVLAAVEERELGPEGTETGSIYMALINYLKEHPPQEEDKIEEPDSPFHFKGDVYIFLSDFVAHLWRSLHEKHTTRSLTGPMALLGAENRRIWRNKKEAAAYKRERVSVYRIPQNIIEEVDSKE